MSDKRTLNNIPCAILERIVFYTVTSEDTFLGPPSAICSMVLVSRSIHRQISYTENSHLYAKIFRFKFDHAAPERRLSKRWNTTACLASELIKRCQALKRIKSTQLDIGDLWAAYLMFLEDDGRNSSQLFEYAGVREYLRSLIMFRTQPQAQDLAWFKDPTVDSLLLWLLWITSDRETIRQEAWLYRQCLLAILHSFVINGYRYPSVHAPEIFFSLPLSVNITSIYDFQILKSEVTHYSHRLQVALPMIAPAAILALVVQAESFQTLPTLPTNHTIPLDRDDAVSQGRTGPTVADIQEFHLHNRIAIVEKLSPNINPSFPDDIDADEGDSDSFTVERMGSRLFDEDWYRLVACYDLENGRTPLRGPVYRLGSLAGSWAGRILQPDLERLTTLTTNQQSLSYPTVSIRYHPLYWKLEEHHCLEPTEPVSMGTDDVFNSDDVLNAWLPRGVTFNPIDDAIEVYDPQTGRTARYATVIPRSAALYGKAEKPLRSWISDESDEVIAGDTIESGLNAAKSNTTVTIDDDDEYCDTASHLSSGVSDILITGTTGQLHGDAWGHYTIYGRVRPWDGLVALLRFPSDPSQEYLGKWIFRGYLHGQNFVGRWRETSTPIDSIGYQGGFVVYKKGVMHE